MATLKRIHVESSNIESWGWADNVLEVEFKNGSVYTYSGVSEYVWKQGQQAESKGSWFAENIRGQYFYFQSRPPTR
jgi:hypothetical protein